MIEFKKFDEFMDLMKKKYKTRFYILFFILKILFLYPIFFLSSFAITYFVFGKNFQNWESLCSIILAAIFTIYLLVVCKIGGLIEFSTKASQKRACFLFLALRDIWCFGNTIFSKNNKFKIFYILFSQSENFKSSLNEMIKIWKKSL